LSSGGRVSDEIPLARDQPPESWLGGYKKIRPPLIMQDPSVEVYIG